MGTQTTRRVTYRGHPSGAPMLAEFLKREGVTVEPFQEQRGLAEMGQEYVVAMTVSGTLLAIKVARDKFRKHTHDKAEVTIEDDEQDDSQA